MSDQFYSELGDLVLQSRLARGETRRSITEATGFHATTLRRIEAGEHRLKVDEAIVLDNYLEFGLFDFMKKWGAEFSRPPEEIEIRGRKYRLVS